MADDADKYYLLICYECRTLQPVPFGQPAETNDALQFRMAEHQTPGGERHRGMLADVKVSDWENPQIRREIETSLFEATRGQGLGDTYYSVKATFAEDAMKCWKAHNRNRTCPDYKSDAKILKPGTDKERKSEGLPLFRSNTYLCDFCPVKSIVQQAVFEERGLYK
jgi:hypothetical protein